VELGEKQENNQKVYNREPCRYGKRVIAQNQSWSVSLELGNWEFGPQEFWTMKLRWQQDWEGKWRF
jgi:hypothetical protein